MDTELALADPAVQSSAVAAGSDNSGSSSAPLIRVGSTATTPAAATDKLLPSSGSDERAEEPSLRPANDPTRQESDAPTRSPAPAATPTQTGANAVPSVAAPLLSGAAGGGGERTNESLTTSASISTRQAEPVPADPSPAAPPSPPLLSTAIDTTGSSDLSSSAARPTTTSPLPPPPPPTAAAAAAASAAPTSTSDPTPTSTSTSTPNPNPTATATPAPTPTPTPIPPNPVAPPPPPPEDPFSLPFSDPYRAVRAASQWNSLLGWARKVRLECAPGGAERGWDFGTGMYHVPRNSAEYTAGVKRLSDEAISSSKTPLPTLSLHATRGGGSSILYSQNPDLGGNMMGSDDENADAGGGGGGERLLTESGRPKRSRAAMTRG